MNKKIINVTMMLILAITLLFSMPTDVQAAKWTKAYNKKIKAYSKSKTGIYSQYCTMKMDSSKTPVLIIKRIDGAQSYPGSTYRYTFFKYKNGKVKKIGSYKIDEALSGDFDTAYKQGKKLALVTGIGDIAKTYKFSIKKGKVVKTTYTEAWAGFSVTYYKGNKKITKKAHKKGVGKLKKTIDFNDNW